MCFTVRMTQKYVYQFWVFLKHVIGGVWNLPYYPAHVALKRCTTILCATVLMLVLHDRVNIALNIQWIRYAPFLSFCSGDLSANISWYLKCTILDTEVDCIYLKVILQVKYLPITIKTQLTGIKVTLETHDCIGVL